MIFDIAMPTLLQKKKFFFYWGINNSPTQQNVHFYSTAYHSEQRSESK